MPHVPCPVWSLCCGLLLQDRVTTGSRRLQPVLLRNRCGEALALTISSERRGSEEVRLTLPDEKGEEVGPLDRSPRHIVQRQERPHV